MFLKNLSDGSEIIESLQILEIGKKTSTLQISLLPIDVGLTEFELVDKEIEIKILEFFEPSDFCIKLKAVDGIGYIEAKLIRLLFSKVIAVDGLGFDDKILTINLSKLTEIGKFSALTSKMSNVKFKSMDDKLMYYFDVNL